MKKANRATSKRNLLRTAALAILAIMAILAIGSIVALIRDGKKAELVEDGFFVRGDHVNLDGFLLSKGYYPRMWTIENDVVTIRYRKNDDTEVCIVDSAATTTVRGTNIRKVAFNKNGNLKECHLRWVISRDDPSDLGAADMMLPVEVVVQVFNSEGGQRR